MLRNHSGRARTPGLQGKTYQAPPKPAILRSGARTAFDDRRGAREIGHADAENHDLRGEGDQYYYEGVIDAQADGALASTRDGHQQARANVERTGEDARHQRMDAEGRLVQLIEEDRDDAEIEAERAHLHGLSLRVYLLFVIFGYLATVPQDLAAATGLPLPPVIQLLAALTLGGVIVLAAHFAGDRAVEFEEARRERAEKPSEYERIKYEYIAALTVPLLFIVAVAVWRGDTFAAEAKAVGGLFTSSTSANIAFACLALAAFLALFFASRSYLRVKPLHDIRRKRSVNKKARDEQQGIADVAERVEAQAKLSLEHLVDHEAKVVAAIEAWRKERTKRLRHRAGVAARKRQHSLVKKGLRPPEPPATATARNSPDRPRPRGGGAARLVDVGRLVDDVRSATDGVSGERRTG